MRKALTARRICLSASLIFGLILISKETWNYLMPAPVSANSHSYNFRNVAIGGGGAHSSFETTVLLTVDETLDALRKAEQLHYRPPGA